MKCLHTHRLPSVYFGLRLLLYLCTLHLSPALMLFSPPPPHSFHFNLRFNSSLATQNSLSLFLFHSCAGWCVQALDKIYKLFKPTVILSRLFKSFKHSEHSLALFFFLLAPSVYHLLSPRQQKIPEPGQAALRSPNVKWKLHLFSCPFASSHHSSLISDALSGFRSLTTSPNSHLDLGKQRRDCGLAKDWACVVSAGRLTRSGTGRWAEQHLPPTCTQSAAPAGGGFTPTTATKVTGLNEREV